MLSFIAIRNGARETIESRIGNWIHLAADRHRFQRRIDEFDSNFGYIFTDIHREHVCDLIQEFNVNSLIVDLNALNLNN